MYYNGFNTPLQVSVLECYSEKNRGSNGERNRGRDGGAACGVLNVEGEYDLMFPHMSFFSCFSFFCVFSFFFDVNPCPSQPPLSLQISINQSIETSFDGHLQWHPPPPLPCPLLPLLPLLLPLPPHPPPPPLTVL